MSKIEEMFQEFKDIAELRDFSKAQHKTILELTKKLKKTEEEKKHLEDLLSKVAPTSMIPNNSSNLIKDIGEVEESICRLELQKLHDITLERVLTYEETKKVEIYTKLLISLNSKPKEEKSDTKNLETGELLQLVKNNDDRKTQ